MGANRRQSHWSRYGGTRMTIRRWPVGGGIRERKIGHPEAVWGEGSRHLVRTGPIWPEGEEPVFAKNRAFGVVRQRKFQSDERPGRGDPRWRRH